MAECGYTLPVWVAAAAVAAVRELRGLPFEAQVQLLLEPAAGRSATAIPVQAAARLSPERALATSCCDPGEVLDLTRGLQVWVEASWIEPDAQGDWLQVLPGAGVGVHSASGEACLSAYARQLLETNLLPLLPGIGREARLPGSRMDPHTSPGQHEQPIPLGVRLSPAGLRPNLQTSGEIQHLPRVTATGGQGPLWAQARSRLDRNRRR